MSLSGILKLMERHPEFCRSIDEAASGMSPTATVRQGARPAFIAALARRTCAPLLVVAPRPEDARRLHDQLLSWLGEDAPVHLLPEPEVLPFERLAVDANTSNQRLAALATLAAARHQGHADDAGEDGDCPPRGRVLSRLGPDIHGTPRSHGRGAAIHERILRMAGRRPSSPRRDAHPVGGDGLSP